MRAARTEQTMTAAFMPWLSGAVVAGEELLDGESDSFDGLELDDGDPDELDCVGDGAGAADKVVS